MTRSSSARACSAAFPPSVSAMRSASRAMRSWTANSVGGWEMSVLRSSSSSSAATAASIRPVPMFLDRRGHPLEEIDEFVGRP
jgi:hypothetical protein